MYVPLSVAKEHCAVTSDVSDSLLQLYIDSAEARVAAFLNRPLSDILDAVPPPDVPDPQGFAAAVRHAVLMIVADAVDNRGTIVDGSVTELRAAENLLFPYRLRLGV